MIRGKQIGLYICLNCFLTSWIAKILIIKIIIVVTTMTEICSVLDIIPPPTEFNIFIFLFNMLACGCLDGNSLSGLLCKDLF